MMNPEPIKQEELPLFVNFVAQGLGSFEER